MGPFKVVSLHESSAEIESLHDSNPVAAHVHLDQLKPYFPGNPVLAPDWDDALDLVLRGQHGAIEEEHQEEHEEEEPEKEKRKRVIMIKQGTLDPRREQTKRHHVMHQPAASPSAHHKNIMR